MNFFDLHCDTVSKAFDEELLLSSDKLQVSLKNEDIFEKHNQCFALFINDKFKGRAAGERAQELYKFYTNNIDEFEKHKNLTAYLTLENCECFGSDLNNISLWKERGVKAATLTWNGENSLGCGSDINSGGLTQFGKKAVREMERLKIAVDVSHLNEDGFCDILKNTESPFVASHSNCFSVATSSRNLKDYQIKEIISRGGLIGICFYPPFLGKGNVFESIFENIKHILTLGGEDVIAFGSDFDGAKMDRKLSNTKNIVALHDFLLKKTKEKELIDKIFFKNTENFFNNVLQ